MNVGSASLALLADTQILVWLATGDRRLTASLRGAIIERDETVRVSIATAWEYADLLARGRLPTRMPLEQILFDFTLDIAAIPPRAWTYAAGLPQLHRDPIDRMLIGHALADCYGLITADTMIRRYPVRCIG